MGAAIVAVMLVVVVMGVLVVGVVPFYVDVCDRRLSMEPDD